MRTGTLLATIVALRTVRAARAEYRIALAATGRGFQRKIAAAAHRMRELGISEEDAQRFGSDGD